MPMGMISGDIDTYLTDNPDDAVRGKYMSQLIIGQQCYY